jgi:hypothetical protein
MNREQIIRMALEAGLTIRGHYDDEGSTPSELVRFFSAAYAAGAAAEREAISDEYSSRLQGALENGVRWLNEAASKKFQEKYPELAGFLQWLDDRASGQA